MKCDHIMSTASSNSLKGAPKIQHINICAVTAGILLSIVAVIVLANLLNENAQSEAMHARHDECVAATNSLMTASDYLTTQARMYVVTGDIQYMNGYLEEINVTCSRDQAVETLKRDENDSQAAARLADALQESNDLAERELYAMRLVAETTNIESMPEDVANVTLSTQDAALNPKEKQALARELMLGDGYSAMKNLIIEDVDGCTTELIEALETETQEVEGYLDRLLLALLVIVIILLGLIGATTLANYFLVMRPMRVHARNIQENDPLEMTGSYELRYVVKAYNQIYQENRRRTMLLKREAEIDALTGVLNRGSYDKLLKHPGEDIALVLIDIDYFKQVNDTFGHEVGDETLKKVAKSIEYYFRNTDYICRIGGDEFAVIMTEMDLGMHDVITSKLHLIADSLADDSGDTPPVTLSAGVVFSAELPSEGNLYHCADIALYEAKRRGRNTHVFYGEYRPE